MKYFLLLMGVLALSAAPRIPVAVAIDFHVQKRIPVAGTDQYKVVIEKQQWEPAQTAIIICDMWNEHWCAGATARVKELAPHMNEVITSARQKGMLIVHAPSDCMDHYKDYPQRKIVTKYASTGGDENNAPLPSEKNAVWPVDQSNEGCNDTPRCEVRSPWNRETDLLEIKKNDVISDSGKELIGLFLEKGIKRVVLMGVHTNMCVINRTFGLRSMSRYGMEVALMRDMTDLMYDARQWPYVDHFEGLGRMVEYIEKYIAPTVVSTDLTGKPAFHFAGDARFQ